MCGHHDMNVVGTCEYVLWGWFLIYVVAYFWFKSSLQICCQHTRIGGSAETFSGPPSTRQPKKYRKDVKAFVEEKQTQ